MSYYLILSRSRKDIIYDSEYLVHLSDVGQVKSFVAKFLKRNHILLRGRLDTTALEKIDGIHKRRNHNGERKKSR